MAINLNSENHWYNAKGGPKYVVYLMEDGTVEEFNYHTESHRWYRWTHRDEIVAKWSEITYRTSYQNPTDRWAVEYIGPRGNNIYEYYPALNRETIQQMLARKALREVIEADIQKDPLALLERSLRQHDWYYFYSDDYGVYSAGSARAEKMQELIKKVEPAKAFELWMKYCPWAKEEQMTLDKFTKVHY